MGENESREKMRWLLRVYVTDRANKKKEGDVEPERETLKTERIAWRDRRKEGRQTKR